MNEFKKTLRFERRAAPVIPEHRPLYKIAQLLLVLHFASRGGKSSLPRLQLFNWAFKTRERQNRLVASVGGGRLNVAAWGFDPAVAIALKFAVAESLMLRISTGYQITEGGKKFIETACRDPESLFLERKFIEKVGKSITETMVTEVAQSWTGI